MFHPKVLDAGRRGVLKRMGQAMTDLGFYLAGGTAVALYYGHRKSIDFDWFTSNEIEDPALLAQELNDEIIPMTVERTARNTIFAHRGKVKMQFLRHAFPILTAPAPWVSYGCEIASLDDLSAMKLLATTHRSTKKDFIDIYVLGLHHVPLAKMIEFYKRKYKQRDISYLLRSLVYFDVADKDSAMPVTLWDIDWLDVKNTLREWVTSYAGSFT